MDDKPKKQEQDEQSRFIERVSSQMTQKIKAQSKEDHIWHAWFCWLVCSAAGGAGCRARLMFPVSRHAYPRHHFVAPPGGFPSPVAQY